MKKKNINKNIRNNNFYINDIMSSIKSRLVINNYNSFNGNSSCIKFYNKWKIN